MNRRDVLRLGTSGLILPTLPSLIGVDEAHATLPISDDYSPRNSGRGFRNSSRYIILHTTELNDVKSLREVKRHGLANYLVETNGDIKRIIDKRKIANHVGRSMWDGLERLNYHSIGIEVVGFHNKMITNAQFDSLGDLIQDLQRIYGISDKNVLPHSMVAYGNPNRWHSRKHRGRKRCGMFFGVKDVRRRLGLADEYTADPDVRSGRLIVADRKLEQILYKQTSLDSVPRTEVEIGDTITKNISAWAIARNQYNLPSTIYTSPDGTQKRGDEITNWEEELKPGTRVTLDGTINENQEFIQTITDTAWSAVGNQYRSKETIYFLPDGRVRQGNELDPNFLDRLPRGTKVLAGYTYGGKILPRRSAYHVVGNRWNDFDTFYRLPNGEIKSGEEITEEGIPQGSIILFKN